jgi:hypothetical protein
MTKQLRPLFLSLIGLVFGVMAAVAVWPAGLGLFADRAAPAFAQNDPGPRDMLPLPPGKYRRFAVCIQVVEGQPHDATYVQGRLRAALSAFSGLQVFMPGMRPNADFPPLIDLGCPRSPARLTPGDDRRVAERPGTALPDPSPYHIHLFVVSPATREMLQRGSYSRRVMPSVEEYATDNPGGDSFLGITSGLYLTVGDFADLSTVEAIFEEAAPLERIVPLPTPTGPRPVLKPASPR